MIPMRQEQNQPIDWPGSPNVISGSGADCSEGRQIRRRMAEMRTGAGNRRKIRIFLICIAVIASGIAGVLFYRHAHTINLNQYLTITLHGYNTYAYPELNLDARAIERDYGDKLSEPMQDNLKVKSKTKGVRDKVAAFCKKYTEYPGCGYVSPSDYLHNGEAVNFHGLDRTEYDYDFHCWVKSKSFSLEVYGAKSIKNANPFQRLRIETTGGDSEDIAEVNTDNMPKPFCYIHFEINPSTYLSNGDRVRVTIPDEDLEWLLQCDGGYTPKRTYKYYTIKDLPALTEDNAESTRQAEHEQWLQKQKAKKAAEEREARKEAAESWSRSHSRRRSRRKTGHGRYSYYSDDDINPNDPDYDEGDEDYDEYDDIDYYDDGWEGGD